MREPRPWLNWLLVAAIVAIFVISFVVAPKPSGDDAEAFSGTDSVVTETLQEEGTEPWFKPIFEPGSGEIESGLFALQAALGAGVLGFALGNLRGRSAERVRQAGGSAAQAGPATGTTEAEGTMKAEPDRG